MPLGRVVIWSRSVGSRGFAGVAYRRAPAFLIACLATRILRGDTNVLFISSVARDVGRGCEEEMDVLGDFGSGVANLRSRMPEYRPERQSTHTDPEQHVMKSTLVKKSARRRRWVGCLKFIHVQELWVSYANTPHLSLSSFAAFESCHPYHLFKSKTKPHTPPAQQPSPSSSSLAQLQA